MNDVKLEGRLTKDPELKGSAEKPVCDMRLAVNGEGNAPTCFIDVAAFGELAGDTAERGMGQKVRGEGRLRYSEWQT